MKFNKILMAGILLLAIFMIGAASAADENITDATDSILSVESVDDNVVANSPGNFAELSSLVENTTAGQTLYLEKDYLRDDKESISITQAITIDGKGHTIDSNKSLLSAFSIKIKGVTLKNINFINGYTFVYAFSGTNGWPYEYSVYNCSFTDCYVKAGASYPAASGATAYNCTFTNCFGAYGGAIYHGNAYNCSFINCRGTQEGGAIEHGDAYNCTFVKCNGGYGGAILGNAYNCTFIDCFCTKQGGAVYGNAYDSTFINCSTPNSDSAISGGVASNCIFINCSDYAVIETVEAKNVNYGTTAYIHVYGIKDNKVNVTVNGKSYIIKIGSDVTLKDLNAGKYDVQVTYAGSDTYKAQNTTTSFRVKKINPISRVRIDNPSINTNVNYQGSAQYTGKNSTLSVNMAMSNVPGNVHVKINGVSQKVKISGSTVSVPLGILNLESYDIEVKYGGSANFNAQTITLSLQMINQYPIKSIKVTPTNPSNNGNIKFSYESSRLYVYLKGTDVPGSINVTINGASYIRDTLGRSAISISLGIMKIGHYDIKVSYDGSENYSAQNATLSFNVEKANPIISTRFISPDLGDLTIIDSIKINYAKNSNIYIYMNSFNVNNNTKMAPGNVHVTINGVDKAISISSPTLIISLSGLKAGTNTICISYAGTQYFRAHNITYSFNVVKISPNMKLQQPTTSVNYSDNITIRATIRDNINGNIWFTISDENNTNVLTDKIHIENGVATCEIPGLNLGEYSLRLYFAGNNQYNAQTIRKNFYVVETAS